MRRSSSVRRVAAALLLSGYVGEITGCTSWKTQQQGAEAVLAAHPELQRADTTWVAQPGAPPVPSVSAHSIRIATTSHPGMLQVTAPRVSGDTPFGTDDARKELGIPLSEVKAVQVRGTSAGKTAALVLGLTVVVVPLAGLVALGGSGYCPGFCTQ
jgi:hypothetical protein